MIISPLVYQGSKRRLLKQIIPYLPNNINTFYDLFCGSCSVGINANAKSYVFNDIDKNIIGIHTSLKETDLQECLNHIDNRIKQFNLTKTNKEGYINFRTYFNSNLYTNLNTKYLDLYILHCYSFSNLLEFNQLVFHSSFGKSSFTECRKSNLITYKNKLSSIDCIFNSNSFSEYIEFEKDDFVYLDPPYLITSAEYNKIWNKDKEIEFLNYLEFLNKNNVNFMLSNVVTYKDKTNDLLLDFIKSNNFNVYNMNINYNVGRNSVNNVGEILLTNYENECVLF